MQLRYIIRNDKKVLQFGIPAILDNYSTLWTDVPVTCDKHKWDNYRDERTQQVYSMCSECREISEKRMK